MGAYVELHAKSAFSFLRGASLPEQLAEVAGQAGLSLWQFVIEMEFTRLPASIQKQRNSASVPL